MVPASFNTTIVFGLEESFLRANHTLVCVVLGFEGQDSWMEVWKEAPCPAALPGGARGGVPEDDFSP